MTYKILINLQLQAVIDKEREEKIYKNKKL